MCLALAPDPMLLRLRCWPRRTNSRTNLRRFYVSQKHIGTCWSEALTDWIENRVTARLAPGHRPGSTPMSHAMAAAEADKSGAPKSGTASVPGPELQYSRSEGRKSKVRVYAGVCSVLKAPQTKCSSFALSLSFLFVWMLHSSSAVEKARAQVACRMALSALIGT